MLDVHAQYPDAVVISAIRIPNKNDLSHSLEKTGLS